MGGVRDAHTFPTTEGLRVVKGDDQLNVIMCAGRGGPGQSVSQGCPHLPHTFPATDEWAQDGDDQLQ